MEVLVLPLAAPRLLKLFLLKKIRLYVVANYELKLMRLRDNPEVLLLHSDYQFVKKPILFLHLWLDCS
ncbi:hypothetical protein COZ60_02360 [Candidatus Bathyarchaeota archaeon CG_4_8_14_3_um_filter_42_8]|nr:MAG: hypothetical protein COZ60_02360 [Candidatus Bathyarchaeota archaeon CG_4_8_14_3_um_filter_42_8]